jgi:hypothetical protein
MFRPLLFVAKTFLCEVVSIINKSELPRKNINCAANVHVTQLNIFSFAASQEHSVILNVELQTHIITRSIVEYKGKDNLAQFHHHSS